MMATQPYTPADSLLASAAIFRAAGQDFSADLSQQMAAEAVEHPGLYRWWAREQADRAARIARSASL